MGRLVGSKNTDGLLNSYDYTSLVSIIKALRQLLRLEEKAIRGNDAALVIMTDLKSGLDMYKGQPRILTDRQRQVLKLCLVEDNSETDVAEALNITQQSVHFIIQAGVRRIQKYLLTGEVTPIGFTDSEEQNIIRMYLDGMKPIEIAEKLKKKPSTIRRKIKYLKSKGKISMEVVDDVLGKK